MKKGVCTIALACKKEPEIIIYYEDNNIVAYRGAWKEGRCPENSTAALQKAIEMKCAGSERDVLLTADDSLIVEHDLKYGGQPVEKSTYASLAQKDFSMERNYQHFVNTSLLHHKFDYATTDNLKGLFKVLNKMK